MSLAPLRRLKVHAWSRLNHAVMGQRCSGELRRHEGASLSWGDVVGDADDSYDFTQLMPFLEKLHSGADLVVGNRFRGGIATGAMPLLHRFLGNPVLSLLGRLFFRIDIGDFHCGLRGFVRDRILAIDLRSIGMEFASEIGPLVPHTSVDHGVYSPQRGATG